MKRIKLNHNKYALIDDDQFSKISEYKWSYMTVYKGITNIGYVYTSTCHKNKKSKIYLHRLIMNAPKNTQVDHINHDTLDNRKINLRICTNAQNQFNQKVHTFKKSSKYKGVFFHKQSSTWRSQIGFMNKIHHLGAYPSEIEAAKAYDKRAKELFGEFARPNFI